jgi:hypothetical protein
MVPELMRLLGVDLNLKFAEIRAQAEDFRATTIRAVAGQVRETSLMVGFAVMVRSQLWPHWLLYLSPSTDGWKCTMGHSRRSLQWAW